MCVGEFGPKMQETSKCDPRHEFPDNHKQKKAHLNASHEKETHPMSVNTSSIQGETFSTNQAHSQGSTGPLDLANHLKKVPLTHNRHGDLPSSFQDESWGQRPVPPVGRPLWSADHRSVRLGPIFHGSTLHSMLKMVPGDSRGISPREGPLPPL